MKEPDSPATQGTDPLERLTCAELAHEGETDEAYVEHLEAIGLLHPSDGAYSWPDIHRVRTVRALEAAGMSLDRIAAANASGSINFDFAQDIMQRPRPRTGRTFSEFAASLGDRGALAGETMEMLGLAHPSDDKPMREDEEAMLRELIDVWADDPAILRRASRIVGQAIRQIVEGWTTLHYELYRSLGGSRRDGWPAELLEREPVMAGRAIRLVEDLPGWLTVRHLELVFYADMIENIEMQIEPFAERRSDPGVRQPAVVFMDLSGFTAMTEAEGNAAAAMTTARFDDAASRAALRGGGRVVKLLGDGALLLFPDADSAVQATSWVRDELADLPLRLHAGIDSGPVAERDGDVFGRTVNMASRLASAANDGQILVSTAARDAASGLPESAVRPVGPLQLKGLERPVPAFAVI